MQFICIFIRFEKNIINFIIFKKLLTMGNYFVILVIYTNLNNTIL